MLSKDLIVRIKNIRERGFTPLNLLALTIPVVVAMTACSGPIDLSQKEQQLGSADATRGGEHIIWPDSPPSVADGKVYYEQNNCAQCHGVDGKGAGQAPGGQAVLDLTNAELMRSRKPIDQFRLIAFGACTFEKTPTTTSISNGITPAEGEKGVDMKHEPFGTKLKTRQLWDLVFYVRSLSVPLLSQDDRLKIKPVFGANCAVCHGTRGAGDGPLNKGLVLQPNPANFNQFDRFYDRTDEQLWDHIANGIKWEGMPNFLGKQDRGNKVKFDADYIWKLVQYVRNFHEDSDYALEGPKKALLEHNTVTKVSQRAKPSSHGHVQSATTESGLDRGLIGFKISGADRPARKVSLQ